MFTTASHCRSALLLDAVGEMRISIPTKAFIVLTTYQTIYEFTSITTSSSESTVEYPQPAKGQCRALFLHACPVGRYGGAGSVTSVHVAAPRSRVHTEQPVNNCAIISFFPRGFVDSLGFASLQPFTYIPAACIFPGSNFYHTLVLYTLGPIVMVVFVALLFAIVMAVQGLRNNMTGLKQVEWNGMEEWKNGRMEHAGTQAGRHKTRTQRRGMGENGMQGPLFAVAHYYTGAESARRRSR